MSRDCAPALQPGQQSETSSKKKKQKTEINYFKSHRKENLRSCEIKVMCWLGVYLVHVNPAHWEVEAEYHLRLLI